MKTARRDKWVADERSLQAKHGFKKDCDKDGKHLSYLVCCDSDMHQTEYSKVVMQSDI